MPAHWPLPLIPCLFSCTMINPFIMVTCLYWTHPQYCWFSVQWTIFFQTYPQVYMMTLSICRCYPKQSVSIYNYVQVLYTSKWPNICVLLLTEVQFCVVLQDILCISSLFHLFTSFGFLSLGIANSAHLHLRLYIFPFCFPSMMFVMCYIVVFISRMSLHLK